jgi:hypothetical protein
MQFVNKIKHGYHLVGKAYITKAYNHEWSH